VFLGEDAPMVILSQNGELSVLLSGTEMATCKGNVTKFAQLVGNRLTALSL
jgi:hypothetical protein